MQSVVTFQFRFIVLNHSSEPGVIYNFEKNVGTLCNWYIFHLKMNLDEAIEILALEPLMPSFNSREYSMPGIFLHSAFINRLFFLYK